ncbi:hypothetical protein HF329_00530 [Chitinophaga oryzae]|uniref:Uncharacterized protein n=1 Tax=Chitinophaga oryzae TaxID=2725414 RepID=A0AAE6ZDH9_9BACT|nr:hypothetical protein [Chitinophaga oryzae]QJB29872.1 hypothetical protein HF329_00530 [Chitinophaga oryzae]
MARQLILENKGISAAEWFIPPFRIHEGELVVLNLKNPIYGPAVQDFLSTSLPVKLPILR